MQAFGKFNVFRHHLILLLSQGPAHDGEMHAGRGVTQCCEHKR
jgi:hypothetical protein